VNTTAAAMTETFRHFATWAEDVVAEQASMVVFTE
jgi:hypothetical protein